MKFRQMANRSVCSREIFGVLFCDSNALGRFIDAGHGLAWLVTLRRIGVVKCAVGQQEMWIDFVVAERCWMHIFSGSCGLRVPIFLQLEPCHRLRRYCAAIEGTYWLGFRERTLHQLCFCVGLDK